MSVDDVEAGPDSVEINREIYVAVSFPILEHRKCLNCREPFNSGRNVSDRIDPQREKDFLMTCVPES